MVAAPAPADIDSTRYGQNRQARRGAWVLAIILHLAVALLLLIQKAAPIINQSQPALNAFNLLAEADAGEQQEKVQKKAEKRTEAKQSDATTPPAKTEPPPQPQPPVVNDFQMPFILISRQDFASSNIGKMPSRRVATGNQEDSKAAYGPGAGPGGATLYPADWYRAPTDTELGGYLRPGQPSRGWGQIGCRTVEHYKVTDCFIMGESPMGSGFGRSVLNAAWQFLVQPPRVNGNPQVGSWVSIKIYYSPEGTKLGANG